MPTLTKSQAYDAAFEAFMQDNLGAPAWLNALRKDAYARFTALGFPTRKHEEWRFTNVTPIAETNFERALPASLTPEDYRAVPFHDLGGIRVVFVNGRFAPELSALENLPKGLHIASLAEQLRANGASLESHLAQYAQYEEHPFVALNTAFLEDGAYIELARAAVIEAPIHLLFLSQASGQPVVSHPRTLVVAAEHSQATIIETYVDRDEGATFTNAVTEFVVAEGALLDHYKVTEESDHGYHIATMQIQQAQQSAFVSHNVTLAGAIVRNDHNAVLSGEHISTTLNGLYLARGKQLVDNHTAIDHAMPNCESHELYKGILDDQSRGVFNGKIFVRQDAQKTDAKQTNQTLLLSKDAQIDTKPQLEIFADDVRCTHGATVGQLDKDLVFYLRARGIDEATGRAMLTYAFASDVIDRIKVEPLRETIHARMFTQLPKGLRTEEG